MRENERKKDSKWEREKKGKEGSDKFEEETKRLVSSREKRKSNFMDWASGPVWVVVAFCTV